MLYVPLEHGVGGNAGSEQTWPAGHIVQAMRSLAETPAGEYLPCTQRCGASSGSGHENPPGHAAQTPLDEYCPNEHVMGIVEPSEQSKPAGQARHVVEDPRLYVPFRQITGSLFRKGHRDPAGHDTHEVDAFALVYEPGPQTLHECEPELGAYVPGLQALHSERAPSLYLPGTHGAGLLSGVSHGWPFQHSVHPMSPARL